GTCYGVETCDPEVGWTGCDAATPAAEVCDGIDNDCNNVVDDGLPTGASCTNEVEGVGACEGKLVCQGTAGWACQGPMPEPETCDCKHNDCDGLTGEAFMDEGGAYALDAHCGTCGNDCATGIANGVGT